MQKSKARQAVAGARSAEEAWKALNAADLAPPGPRLFLEAVMDRCERCDGKGVFVASDPWSGDGVCQHCVDGLTFRETRTRPHPPSVEACIRFADRSTEVRKAEALARTIADRLESWTGSRPPDIRWRLDFARATAPRLEAFARVVRSVAILLDQPELDPDSDYREPWVSVGAEQWRQACALGPAGRIPDPPSRLGGACFADVPDPFTPLRDLRAATFDLDTLTAEYLQLAVRSPYPTALCACIRARELERCASLKLVASECIVRSQFHADTYAETWLCTLCGRTHHRNVSA